MKNSERQAVMLNGYQSFSFGSSICSPVLSAGKRTGSKLRGKTRGFIVLSAERTGSKQNDAELTTSGTAVVI